MVSNDLQDLRPEDNLSSSVSIINSNFWKLKDAIEGGGSLAAYDKNVRKMIEDLKNEINERLDSVQGVLTSQSLVIGSIIEGDAGEDSVSSILYTYVSKTDAYEQAIASLEAKIENQEEDLKIVAGISSYVENAIEEGYARANSQMYAQIQDELDTIGAGLSLDAFKDYATGLEQATAVLAASVNDIKSELIMTATSYKGVKQAQTIITNTVDDVRSDLELTATKTSNLEKAQANLTTAVCGAQAQLTQLALATASMQVAVAGLKAAIDTDDDGDDDIWAALSLYAKKSELGELAWAALSASLDREYGANGGVATSLVGRDEYTSAQTSIWASINGAYGLMTTFVSKTEISTTVSNAIAGAIDDNIEATIIQYLEDNADYSSSITSIENRIDDVEAGLDIYVSKNKDTGKIESGISLAADQIDLTGKTMSFTGNQINISTNNFKLNGDGNVEMTGTINATGGTFNGSVKANDFTVLNDNKQEALVFAIWNSTYENYYSQTKPSNVTIGTPVLIATTYKSDGSVDNVYITDMKILNGTGSASVEFTNTYYTGSFNAITKTANEIMSDINKGTSKTLFTTTIIKSGDYYYKNSTEGDLASGIVLGSPVKRSYNITISSDSEFNGAVVCVTGYLFPYYAFNNGKLNTSRYINIIPYVCVYKNGTGTTSYNLSLYSNGYLYIKDINYSGSIDNTPYIYYEDYTSSQSHTVVSENLNDATTSISNLYLVTETSDSTYTTFTSDETDRAA